ncbi:hypothetical protein [Paenibacillus sp. sgz500958]|uniref:hypothetical protein n=1 Tax=Paenibacillus sp. sgz500958 TaxID=3242475 RepID=UPI0036D26DB0
MIKRLEVSYPLIHTFPRHGFCLSILNRRDGFLPWMYSNHIQLRCRTEVFEQKNFVSDWFDFDSYFLMLDDNPWLQSQSLLRDFLKKHVPDRLQFVMDMIDDGYYVFTYLDEYYVPGTYAYHNIRFPHAFLIYGYNKVESTLDIALYNEHRNFAFSTISFEDFIQAFDEMEVTQSFMNSNFLLKPRPPFDYHYDLKMNIQAFEDYLLSRKTCDHQYDQYRLKGAGIRKDAYGLAVYDCLVRYISILEDQEVYYDLRPLHLLWEHKRCLKDHIKYLQHQRILTEGSFLIEKATELEKNALTMRNLMIKATLNYKMGTVDLKSLGGIKERLRELKNKEALFLEELLEQMIEERVCPS